MTIKFVLDNTQKKEEALANEILQLIHSKPQIDDATKKLATFMEVVFRTAKKKEIPPEAEMPKGKSPQLLKQAPIKLEKKEYLIRLFQTPVGIMINKEEDELLYRAMEPHPDASIINAVKETIKKDFARNHGLLESQAYLKEKFEKACKKLNTPCDADIIRRGTYYLKRDLLGFRRIDPLMHDANVTGIFCEGLNKPIKIEYKGVPEKIETNITFKDPKDLNTLINKIAAFAGIPISEATPIIDTVINGFKINATVGMGDISSKLTIKKLDL
ncbi:MAG: hypothetical protein V1914_01605 [archaeon]